MGAAAPGARVLDGDAVSGEREVEALRQARALIADPARWCQYEGARGRSGRGVDLLGRSAVAWCALGALERVCWRLGVGLIGPRERLDRAAKHVAKREYGSSPALVNDRLGHDAVLRMYDLAIGECEAAG